MNYVLNYPEWTIALCVLAGLLYAVVLYLRERNLEESGSWLRWVLGIFRFGAVTTIALLLLGILLEQKTEIEEKPVIIVGHDNSVSLTLGKDSTYIREDYPSEFRAFVNRLRADFQVAYYTFGEQLYTDERDLSFTDKQSDLSLFLTEVYSRFYNRNIGAVVLASDGIYNKGLDPSVSAQRIKNTGIYTVALGDTSVKRDLLLEKVRHNRVVFLGNDFPIEVMVKADRLRGRSAKLELFQGGTLLSSQEVTIDQTAYLQNFSFRVEAKTPGIHNYTLRLTELDGEYTYTNNSKTIYVDVQNNKQQVLLLAHAPHPDLGALKFAIESSPGYEVDVAFGRDFDGNVEPYGLVVMHQLPSLRYGMDAVLAKLQNAGKPVLFVLGSQTFYGKFNQLKTGLTHIGFSGTLDAVNAAIRSDFTLFNVSPAIKEQAGKFPVLHAPFGTLRTAGGVEVLLNQRKGNIDKGEPLMAFNSWNGIRTGFIVGEGIWRWRLQEPTVFKELTQKMVQYLATKEDKSFFRILAKTDFNENESIVFKAEVYNESYELINTPSVELEITGEDGQKYPYDFGTEGRGYSLNAGKLPVGKYTYIAKANANGKVYELSGEFSVKPIRVEYANSVADHQLLHNMAVNNGGEMAYPGDLDALYNKIISRNDLRPMVYTQSKFEDVVNWKWIFFLVIGLLTVEWFLRKRNGAY